jgi:hypothetical protein
MVAAINEQPAAPADQPSARACKEVTMPADSVIIVAVIAVAFVVFMAVLAITAWYDRNGRHPQ